MTELMFLHIIVPDFKLSFQLCSFVRIQWVISIVFQGHIIFSLNLQQAVSANVKLSF